jgi:hypothetical protein
MKIQGIRETDYDEKTVGFLKQQTLNAFKNVAKRKAAELQSSKSGGYWAAARGGGKQAQFESQIDESKYIDLLKFWVLFQDENRVT